MAGRISEIGVMLSFQQGFRKLRIRLIHPNKNVPENPFNRMVGRTTTGVNFNSSLALICEKAFCINRRLDEEAKKFTASLGRTASFPIA